MTHFLGGVFGMTVVAATREEWPELVRRAREMGAFDIGREDDGEEPYDLVIDERHGMILVNPDRASEIFETLKRSIPEALAESVGTPASRRQEE